MTSYFNFCVHTLRKRVKVIQYYQSCLPSLKSKRVFVFFSLFFFFTIYDKFFNFERKSYNNRVIFNTWRYHFYVRFTDIDRTRNIDEYIEMHFFFRYNIRSYRLNRSKSTYKSLNNDIKNFFSTISTRNLKPVGFTDYIRSSVKFRMSRYERERITSFRF